MKTKDFYKGIKRDIEEKFDTSYYKDVEKSLWMGKRNKQKAQYYVNWNALGTYNFFNSINNNI